MKIIRLSAILAIISITIITIIFLAVISPLHGLKILTFPILLTGIVFWILSLILFITGLTNKKKEINQKKTIVKALLLIISFIPVGLLFIMLSGSVRTKITVNVINQSDFIGSHLMIYGTGNIFENSDTLKIENFNKGEKIEYITRPSTKAFRKGYIRMELDINNKHLSKDIAGEFSINPYEIQQNWVVLVDNQLVK